MGFIAKIPPEERSTLSLQGLSLLNTTKAG